jgi:hypothetical protein
MDANSLILALASQPGFLEVREDQAGETRIVTGVDRRIGEDNQEYLVLLSAPRSKPETAPEPEDKGKSGYHSWTPEERAEYDRMYDR